jgi:hypothetical protein
MTHDAPNRPARNLADALLEPICPRAERVLRDAHLASYLEPHKWPEVQCVADALCDAMGRGRRPLSTFDRDSGVRAIVALYAAGYSPGDLKRAATLAPKQEWWNKDGARRGLSTLTPEVVDRALHDPADGRVNALVRSARAAADREQGSAPAPLGVLLAAAGGHNAT